MLFLHVKATDSQRFSSDGDDSATHTRRLNISPFPSQYDIDDGYDASNSIEEIEATLRDFEDDHLDTEFSHTQWSPASYSSTAPTFSSATGTFTYRGSPSFVSLPTFPRDRHRITLMPGVISRKEQRNPGLPRLLFQAPPVLSLLQKMSVNLLS